MPIPAPTNSLAVADASEVTALIQRSLDAVREDARSNQYLDEAIRVLPVGGYRSAIGSIWNAVVDDLRQKIIYRSLDLFNSSIQLGRTVANYEDFQNHVNDDQLIEGAYKTGVIGWEASKILRHCKETRHVFDGHPSSSTPSLVKVLSMIDDCVKYVLSQPYPSKIIDISVYLAQMGQADYDRNQISIEMALSELPDVYKNELINRIFTTYINTSSSSTFRSNAEFVTPIFWNVLAPDIQRQIVRRVDQEIIAGNVDKTTLALSLITTVGGQKFLSDGARRYVLEPLVLRLKSSLDAWDVEAEVVRALQPYAAFVPDSLVEDYVSSIVQTYVGYTGTSYQYSRTDFYSNAAAMYIPGMMQAFDDRFVAAFVHTIRSSTVLRGRLRSPSKMQRLRNLATIALDKSSAAFADRGILEALVDPTREPDFLRAVGLSAPLAP